jgi:hypothetical protein
MKTQRTIFFFMFVAIFIFASCEKEAGEGGNSTIYGKIYVKDYNGTFTFLNGEYYGADENVYIIYGSSDGSGDQVYGYDDDVNTSYDGSYEFKYLRPGKYTIYAYSKDSTLLDPSGKVAMKKEVEITEKNQEVEVPEIIIFN